MIDSTAISANAKWPNESILIRDGLQSAYKLSQQLEHFGLQNLHLPWCEIRLKRIVEHAREIDFSKGKKKAARTRKINYRKIYKKAVLVINQIEQALEDFSTNLPEEFLSTDPYKRTLILHLLDQIEQCLVRVTTVILNSYQRLELNVKVPVTEKILSHCEEQASIICKGGREPTFGYKPNLGRSANGFVSVFELTCGNPSDSERLLDVVAQSIENTSITPELLNVDDGYSSAENLQEARETYKIDQVSMSGAKGLKVIGEEQYYDEELSQARKDRSAVESLMFTLKHNHQFGQLGRRGYASVRQECLVKILAYNVDQIIRVRNRQPPMAKAA